MDVIYFIDCLLYLYGLWTKLASSRYKKYGLFLYVYPFSEIGHFCCLVVVGDLNHLISDMYICIRIVYAYVYL
jgi:hypothetical protein